MTLRTMSVVSALLLGVALADVSSVPHPAPPLPNGWERTEVQVPANYPLTLRLTLARTNLERVFEIARQVSDPNSASYGQYLTGAQLADLTAPKAEHLATVRTWLSTADERTTYNCLDDGVCDVKLHAAAAEALLKTKFYNVANAATGQKAVLASDYELPAQVHAAVVAIYGMHGLPLPPREDQPVQNQPAAVTPAVIASTYDVSGVSPSGSLKNRQAVAEFQGQTMKPSDLTAFFKKFDAAAPESASTVHKFVPSGGKGSAGIEASLDIEYIMGVAPGVLTEFWYFGGNDFCADLQKWTSLILTSEDAPLVHSVSYGWQGQVTQIGCKTSEITDIDANFAKLAAKGITIIFASGDSGSGYSPFSADNATKKKKLMYPSWPASSPWITAVGSTRFIDQTVGHPEMATDQFGSGGGFSTMFEAFADQKASIKTYLDNAPKLPPSGSFPPGGRATPDVAALGEGFQVLADGQIQSVGGTSASTPSFAGLVSLLNEARLKAGKPAMGYLNPWLYQHPDSFTDITVGTNAIGRGGESLGKYGFSCTKGWDPVTGLGTPIFSKMLSAAMAGTPATTVSKEIIV